MASSLRAVLLPIPLVLASCLGSVRDDEGTRADEGTSQGEDASTGGTSSSSSSSSSSGGTEGVTDAADARSGVACQIAGLSGPPVAPCPAGEYCKADPSAGAVCASGHCTPVPPPPPPSCPGMECGCDGVLRCAGHSASAGVDLGPGRCGIVCGDKTCDAVTEYCEHWPGGCGIEPPDGTGCTNPPSFACKPIPGACNADRSCSCMMTQGGRIGTCSEDGGKLRMDLPPPP